MRQIQILLALVGVGLVRSQLPLDDPCVLTRFLVKFGATKPIDLEIPQNCTFGTINWHYPQGTMDMHLTRPGGPYSLCLEESWATFLAGVKKVIDGVETDIPLPTKDNPACTEDRDGKTELLIRSTVSPDMPLVYYMTIFYFRVVPRVAT